MDAIEVNNLRIAFTRAGTGPPLVLLYGILGDSRKWSRQVHELSDEFTVCVAWDTAGCGRSSNPPETFHLPEYADYLAAFVKALGVESPHVLGLSWGGGLALQPYARHPTIPRTLVLAGSYAEWADSLPAGECEQRIAQCLRESHLPPDQFMPGWIPGLLTSSAPAALIAEVVAIMSDFHPPGYQTVAQAFAEADLRSVLPRIMLPTLLLWGDEDVRSPLAVAEQLHEAILGSQFAILRGVGHLSNVEAPERRHAAVRAFLRSVAHS